MKWLTFRSKKMIIPHIYRTIDNINNSRDSDKCMDKISSSLPENMDISPSMMLSPSPAKTDWLGQFANEINKPMIF